MKLDRLAGGRVLFAALALAPLLMAAKGEGCDSGDPAVDTPDVAGVWDLTYEDDLKVKITIGGAVYEETIGPQGGAIEIDHEGNPIVFDLDCAKPEIVCPSEVWPDNVTLAQNNENLPRNVTVTIPTTDCDGELVAPEPDSCGAETNNPDCDMVCDGEVTLSSVDTIGFINPAGDHLDVFLGATAASNGVNCALLGVSIASTDLVTTGSGEEGNWQAVELANGEVITGFAGGCLWAGDVNDDGTIEGLVVAATVELRTSFGGVRQ